MTVWKYELKVNPQEPQMLEIPRGSKFLCFKNQREIPVIWIGVHDTEAVKITTLFVLLETGKIYDFGNIDPIYRGTAMFMQGMYILHLFQE